MDTKTKNTIDVSFPKVNGKMAKIETQPSGQRYQDLQ